MINTDAFYLLVLGTAGAYAVYSMNERPRSHIVEGAGHVSSDGTTDMQNRLDVLMSRITKYHKQVNESNEGEAYELKADKSIDYDNENRKGEEDDGSHLYHFNDLIKADSSNFRVYTNENDKHPLDPTPTQQASLIALRQDLANIYSLVMAYASEQDTTLQEQRQRIDVLSQMEELNQETIKDTTASLKEQGTNKRRLIKNNEYFLNRYRAINEIIRYLILFIVILTFVQYLYIKGYFSESFGSIFVPLSIGVALFFLYYKYINIMRRNPLDYDEIDWNDVPVKGKKSEEFTGMPADTFSGISNV